MQPAEIVFKGILDRASHKGIGLSNLKLQKIAYYCQGYHLALLDSPCFSNQVEAWEHGPVVRSAYMHYRPFGEKDIDEAVQGYFELLPKGARQVIELVLDLFGHCTAWYLRNLTHEESPWLDVYVEGQKNVIGNDRIKQYFTLKIEHEMNSEVAQLLSLMEETKTVRVPKSINSEEEFIAWLHF